MDTKEPPLALENGLDLGKLLTTGSVLHINEDYDDAEYNAIFDNNEDKIIDYIGKPVSSFEEFEKELKPVDENGLVKKKILEEGGGLPLHKGCTVSLIFSGYWENETEPFDYTKSHKPLVVNLNENGLLPGIQIAIESMLVGEMAVFHLSYVVMYGQMGVPPRIKPKADCIFYIKLIKSINTPKEGKLDFSEPNIFDRVHHEVKVLYSLGVTFHKTKNFTAAIQSFRKAINMLHRCRLADEKEENIQEKLLIKLYINLLVCYNETKQPLKSCTICKELNRLNSLWNNVKALFHNAKALRMIGQFDAAQKRLKRALQLSPDNEKIIAELTILTKTRDSCNQAKLVENKILDSNIINDAFKTEVDNLIKNFKENVNICKLTLPCNLNAAEMDYIKETCVKENLFCNQIQKEYLLDKEEEQVPIESKIDLFI
ncbi:inactive peptidyl-prolyl cis-trans isomerase shutdown-like [Vanessa cardui]|uniref:inactive peptidyl-prolyl cis-trans isomerase shutdown-like n=1 Tax=Vanessa cardui TaxID=171605 RepID=UPI001F14104B|nr:inactive peptidyl-prolyl cis-trans isomerase shutdown-like [Vanessa cardui]